MAFPKAPNPGLIVSGGLVFLVVIGFGIWLALTNPPVRQVIARAASDVMGTAADNHAAATVDPTPAAAAPALTPSPVHRASRKESLTPPAAESTTPPEAEAPHITASPGEVDAPAATPAPATASTANRTFTYMDHDVIPPVALIQPQFTPLRLGLVQDTVVRLELIINEQGYVESAKVPKDPETLVDAMLYSMALQAARSWKFVPATHDGKPVRYRDVLAFDQDGHPVPR